MISDRILLMSYLVGLRKVDSLQRGTDIITEVAVNGKIKTKYFGQILY